MTCLNEEACDESDDYNGLMEVWLVHLDQDESPEIIAITVNNCEYASAKSNVFRRTENRMLKVSSKELRKITSSLRKRATNNELYARHALLLVKPAELRLREDLIEQLEQEEAKSNSKRLLKYHKKWSGLLKEESENSIEYCHYEFLIQSLLGDRPSDSFQP
ncbi:MAG: hypothetical protein GY854_02475 [Deltaproteobacteria bacterium]|nr:hypothetical protein [Deltaproteobacteria bacterium]